MIQTDVQKQILHSKQGGRCANCVNFILSNEAESAYINYKLPLEQGGTNSQDNLETNMFRMSVANIIIYNII